MALLINCSRCQLLDRCLLRTGRAGAALAASERVLVACFATLEWHWNLSCCPLTRGRCSQATATQRWPQAGIHHTAPPMAEGGCRTLKMMAAATAYAGGMSACVGQKPPVIPETAADDGPALRLPEAFSTNGMRNPHLSVHRQMVRHDCRRNRQRRPALRTAWIETLGITGSEHGA